MSLARSFSSARWYCVGEVCRVRTPGFEREAGRRGVEVEDGFGKSDGGVLGVKDIDRRWLEGVRGLLVRLRASNIWISMSSSTLSIHPEYRTGTRLLEYSAPASGGQSQMDFGEKGVSRFPLNVDWPGKLVNEGPSGSGLRRAGGVGVSASSRGVPSKRSRSDNDDDSGCIEITLVSESGGAVRTMESVVFTLFRVVIVE